MPDDAGDGAHAGRTQADVLIAGASFAGMEIYRALRRTRAGRDLFIIMVDRQAEHGYIPLAHERLTERLPLAESTLPTARCFEHDVHARYVVDEVITMDPAARTVSLRSGLTLHGRFLVIALGSQLAPPASLPGHHHLLRYKFEEEFRGARVQVERAIADGQNLLVIGGGISGVELAGDLALKTLQPRASGAGQVLLIEAGDRLVPNLTARASRDALRALEAQGVQVHLNTRVSRAEERQLHLTDRDTGEARSVRGVGIWAAGILPNPLLVRLGLKVTKQGNLATRETLQCSTADGAVLPNVFACGDALRVVTQAQEWPTMQRAIECIWQAKVVARNIVTLATSHLATPALRAHKLWRDFPYGVSMGRASAITYGRLVVELGRLAIWFRRFLMHQYMRRYTRGAALKRLE